MFVRGRETEIERTRDGDGKEGDLQSVIPILPLPMLTAFRLRKQNRTFLDMPMSTERQLKSSRFFPFLFFFEYWSHIISQWCIAILQSTLSLSISPSLPLSKIVHANVT